MSRYAGYPRCALMSRALCASTKPRDSRDHAVPKFEDATHYLHVLVRHRLLL